jgi:predicted phosphodiesterase
MNIQKTKADTLTELAKEYANLARKLGKLPNKRETAKFLASTDKIHRIAESFSKFQAFALENHPDIQNLAVPVRINSSDITEYRLGLEAKKVAGVNNNILVRENVMDYVEKFSESVFKGRMAPVKYPKKKKAIKRFFNLVISDTHFGSDVKAEETGVANYGVKEESRRLAKVVQETIEYKKEHRAETALNVLLIGDLTNGTLHDPRDGAPMAEQVCRAIHLLSQALMRLASEFPSVDVYCESGNHGRRKERHYGRATNQKWDSYETIIYYALKQALANQKNVKIHITKKPYDHFEVFGKKILYTHGDSVLNPGYPGKDIKIGSLETQLNKINAGLKDTEEYSVAVVGHVHVFSQTLLSNGVYMITNGALIPPDEFAVSIGILESPCGQLLFESVEGYPVGDTRFIRVGVDEDKNASLDKIIQPWNNF